MDSQKFYNDLVEARTEIVQNLNNVKSEISRLIVIRDDLQKNLDRQDGAIAAIDAMIKDEPKDDSL
jgi:hypothetical protein